eukprot:454110-Pyramimonas_sp.AAC.1
MYTFGGEKTCVALRLFPWSLSYPSACSQILLRCAYRISLIAHEVHCFTLLAPPLVALQGKGGRLHSHPAHSHPGGRQRAHVLHRVRPSSPKVVHVGTPNMWRTP